MVTSFFDLMVVLLIIGPVILYFLKSLHDNQKQYHRLLNSMPNGVLIQKDNRIIYSNERGIKMLGGEEPDDIIGRSVYDFVHPGDETSLAIHSKLVNNTDQPATSFEQKLVTLDQRVIDVEVTGVPITYHGEKCILTIDRDITDKKKQEQLLQETQKKYEMITNNMHDFIALLNKNGEIEFASPSHVHILGYLIDEKRNQNLIDLAYRDDKESVSELITSMLDVRNTEDKKRLDFRIDHPTRGQLWLEAEITVAITT